jgi:hypothetical protein
MSTKDTTVDARPRFYVDGRISPEMAAFIEAKIASGYTAMGYVRGLIERDMEREGFKYTQTQGK